MEVLTPSSMGLVCILVDPPPSPAPDFGTKISRSAEHKGVDSGNKSVATASLWIATLRVLIQGLTAP